ncbi:MAG: glycoside hydrolase family 44 protein, partial [Opitutales bacterium]
MCKEANAQNTPFGMRLAQTPATPNAKALIVMTTYATSGSRQPRVRNCFRIVATAAALLLPSAEAVADGGATFAIDLSASPTAISPLVYGLNDWARNDITASLSYTLERLGGNRMTGYNWETNASNAGNDWYDSSDTYLVSDFPAAERSIPGIVVTKFVDHARAGNHPAITTLQLAGYVAADTDGTVTEEQTAPSSRWKQVRIVKDGPLSTTPDTTDAYVDLDEQVNFLIQKYGTAANGGVFAYSMDNEPALWSSTHSRIHPSAATVAEILQTTTAAAGMVKNLDPSALVFGPALYGWNAFTSFQDAPDWEALSGTYNWFISAYLDGMKTSADLAGKRLLDVLDLHYYPEAQGLNDNSESIRIVDNNDNSAGVTEARLQAPRSLWDSSYTETSWITQYATLGPINMLPRVNASINEYYPGTKLSITEYDFGGHQNFSGTLAEADVLGIFGRDGVFAACFWGDVIDGAEPNFIAPAFQLYRNFDGRDRDSSFGDQSIPASNPDPASYSCYASIDSATGDIHVIVINKTASAQPATISLG